MKSLFGPVVRRVTRTLRNDKITRSIRVRGIFAQFLSYFSAFLDVI
jgi:hypothetical protein